MNPDDFIPWLKDRLLDWSDFKAESNPAIFEDANSVIKYRYTWTVNSENFGNEIKFSIADIKLIPEFHKQLSWVRSSLATPHLLEHEQGHFDLAELLRDKITKNIRQVFEGKWYPTRGQNDEQQKQFAREDSGVLIAKELEKWEKFLQDAQQEYDSLTDFGQIKEKQQEYNEKFNELRK